MRIALVLALIALVCASAVAIRPRPVMPAPRQPDPAVAAIEREVSRLDGRIDKAMETLINDSTETERLSAKAKLRQLQAELVAVKARVAVAKAAFAREHCPGGRVTRSCP
jgi:hypothetical protein